MSLKVLNPQVLNPQVLIVGAGPVGLTMAAELARYGVSVRIVDKAAQRTDKSKALVLWSRSLELLERAGCADAFVAAGLKVVAANIVAGTKLIGHVGFDDVQSLYPYALMLPQSDTERLLEAHLASLGVAVERQVELASFTDTGGAIAAMLSHPDGREEDVKSDWIVGCDGAHSTVRHTLGLSFDGETMQSDWILADIHLTGMPLPANEMATYFHEDGALVFFPIAPGRYRVIADHGQSQGPHPVDPTLAEVQAVVDRRGPGGIVLSNPIWLSGFRINERKVGTYRSGHAFVAGDAAHVHSPAGGQGMNTGMQDAFNLAWKLALVCRGICTDDRLLDSYSSERSAIGAQVLANAGRMTAVGVLKNHTAQAIRNLLGGVLLGLAPVRRAMADTLSEITIGYPHSPLNGDGDHRLGGPRPGARVAPVQGHPPVGAGPTPRFAVFAAESDATTALLRDYAGVLEPSLRPPFAEDGLWLVRPDGYVACVARHAEPIRTWLGDRLNSRG